MITGLCMKQGDQCHIVSSADETESKTEHSDGSSPTLSLPPWI